MWIHRFLDNSEPNCDTSAFMRRNPIHSVNDECLHSELGNLKKDSDFEGTIFVHNSHKPNWACSLKNLLEKRFF